MTPDLTRCDSPAGSMMRFAWLVMMHLPPGPELDPHIAGNPPEEQVDDSPLAAIDLGSSGHLCLEQEGRVVDLARNQDGPGVRLLFRLDGDWSNRGDRAHEVLTRVGAGFQNHFL